MTTRFTLKRVAATAAITVSALAGTLGISAATGAGQAAAAVDNGRYELTNMVYGIFPVTQDVTVRNNKIYGQSATPLTLIPTPHGAYADVPGGRHTFTKRGPNYYGRSYLGAVPVGDIRLIKKP